MAAFYQDDAVRAERFFREALALDGENAQAHLYYGIFLSLRERDADARKHLEKVLELEPAESALAELARAYLAPRP
jgi:Flp pilus assembly protein TadD